MLEIAMLVYGLRQGWHGAHQPDRTRCRGQSQSEHFCSEAFPALFSLNV